MLLSHNNGLKSPVKSMFCEQQQAYCTIPTLKTNMLDHTASTTYEIQVWYNCEGEEIN